MINMRLRTRKLDPSNLDGHTENSDLDEDEEPLIENSQNQIKEHPQIKFKQSSSRYSVARCFYTHDLESFSERVLILSESKRRSDSQ